MAGNVLRGAGNLLRFASAYARSQEFRTTIASVDPRHHGLERSTGQMRRELAIAPASARPARTLSGAALSLSVITTHRGRTAINLVLPELDPTSIFAGVKTALDAANQLARRLELPLRVVLLSESIPGDVVTAAEQYLRRQFGAATELVPRTAIIDSRFGDDDIWMVTHWTTAHPAQVAAAAGVLRAQQVVYLVQDFEAGFHAWSTDYQVARGTYGAGFALLVNSAPLARYLAARTGVEVPPEQVFAPSLDLDRLRAVSRRRREVGGRIFFYGRPSKPRNMYRLGVAALERAMLELGTRAVEVQVISAGEAHGDRELAPGVVMKSLGTLAWDDYYRQLEVTDVMVSLQASPHPSHPPLEAAVSGAVAIVNDFEGTRAGMHPRVRAVAADPETLGHAIAQAVLDSWARTPARYRPIDEANLGRPLLDAVEVIAARLSTSAVGSEVRR